MLDLAFGFIGEATSNSLLMFCFCNLIIVMILTGSSKSGSIESQDSSFITFNVCNIPSDDQDSCNDYVDEDKTLGAVSSVQDELLIVDSSDSEEEEDRESIHCCDYDDSDDEEEEEDEYENREAEVEEDEEDDDLRKRVEEFIAKINNEWRHEKLRTLNLVC